MPANALIIRPLLHYCAYYADSFKIECPTGSGNLMNLFEVAYEIASRLTRIFLRDATGRQRVFGGAEKFQSDPHWRHNLLFNEYLQATMVPALGSATRRVGLASSPLLIEIVCKLDPQTLLAAGQGAAFSPPR